MFAPLRLNAVIPSIVIFFPLLAQSPQTGIPSRETLQYDVEWRLVSAGKATLSWSASARESNPGWEAKLHLESAGLVSRLFRVNDDYTATLDPNFCAEGTLMMAREANRNRETKVTYDAATKKASYLERDLTKKVTVASHEIDIPPCVHDIVGGLYLLRTLRLEPGHSTQLTLSDGKKNVLVKVESQRREEIKTPLGLEKTVMYEAFLFNNVLYRRPGHLHIWLTDDNRRLPVQIQIRLQFTIGTITLRLEKQEKL
ncbi:MAG: DUF3108 domain-containing protein [Acidobacteriota bacterium]|nr:DUF3108 domain-containing protein [Acidobacteriota bacterium]